MIKIKDVSDAHPGDFVKYNRRLSIILSVDNKEETFSIRLDDGTVIENASIGEMEIFRLKDEYFRL